MMRIPMIGRLLKYSKCAGVCCLMLFAESLIPEAQAGDAPPLTELAIEELMEIEVYGASKFAQKLSEAPSSVSIVTSDEIKKYGYRTLADILRSVRGFFVTSDRNYDFAGIRGFLRPGDYNTRVLLLVDGIRINDNVYDQTFIGTDFPIDVDLIDRVEVIRGPGSSLYGSNAFFAVINVITRRGKDFNGFEATGETGSNDAYKARFSYGRKFENGLGAALSGSYYHSRGNRRLYFREFDSPDTNNGIAEDLDRDRFVDFFGRFALGGFTLAGAYGERRKDVPTAAFDAVFNDSRFSTRDEHYFVDLKYEGMLDGELGAMARLNYNYYKYVGDYPYISEHPDGSQQSVVNTDLTVGEWWGSEVQITKRFFERHRMIAGAEYRDNMRQDQKNYDTEIYLDDRRSSRVWAVYAQGEFVVLRNLVLNAGVRYDDYSTFGPTTNPRLSLIYNPFGGTTLKLIYGAAFRAPNVYELYYNDGRVTSKPNPDLRPEKIRTYELAWEQLIGDNLRGVVNLFYNRISDLISLTVDPADGLLVFRNFCHATAKGLELELEGRWGNGLTARWSYTYQETRDGQTGKTLTNSPRHLAKLNLIAPVAKDRVFLGLEEQYMSRRKTLKGNFTRSVYLTNVTLFSRSLLRNLEASVSVYNLFDHDYGDPGSEEHVQDIIEQDGRTFRFKLTYRF